MKKIYDLVPMDSEGAVRQEVLFLLERADPGFDPLPVADAFTATIDLYHGRYPGYRACNTRYHDFQHITDTALAMTRLIHGAAVAGEPLSGTDLAVGMIATLLHDAGYVQEDGDASGTGGKHTVVHVSRSMDFFEQYARQRDMSDEDIHAGRVMIYCTDLAADFSSIRYPSRRVEVLGKMVGTADLLAQMADRNHLEKLIFLYQEFREGMVTDYESAEDLLRKTMGFYDLVDRRLKNALDDVQRFMRPHFRARWDIDADLYREAIDREKAYLEGILKEADADLLMYLRRKGVVAEQ